MILRVGLLVASCLLAAVAFARAHDVTGRWKNESPEIREWLRTQMAPPRGREYCCSIADGIDAEEDIRNGHYWVRFKIGDHQVDWMEVPDKVVINEPNKYGVPVVWYSASYQNGQLSTVGIRCYAPGLKS